MTWPPPGHPQCENPVLTLWVTGRRPYRVQLHALNLRLGRKYEYEYTRDARARARGPPRLIPGRRDDARTRPSGPFTRTHIMGAESRIATLSAQLQPTRRMPPPTEPAFSSAAASIQGRVSPGWEKVRTAFTENFAQRDELGASCCVTYKGEVVVDLCTGSSSARVPLSLSCCTFFMRSWRALGH